MYPVGSALPVEALEPGPLLLVGPAMSGKYDLLLDVLGAGFDRDEGGLFLTTNRAAKLVIEDVEGTVGYQPLGLRIVDCLAEHEEAGRRYPNGRVEFVSSPGDLTGVGIAVARQLDRFEATATSRLRVACDSLSTLLMYVDLKAVFRFLHVVMARIERLEGLGLFVIDPTVHDPETVSVIRQLFDGVIETRSAEGRRQVRLAGVPDTSSAWHTRT